MITTGADARSIISLERQLGRTAGWQTARARALGDEVLMCTLTGGGPRANKHWIVPMISLMGTCTFRSPIVAAGWLPVSGLFMVPRNVTEEDHTAPIGMGLDEEVRGIALPTDLQLVFLGAQGPWALWMGLASSAAPLLVPEAWTIRAIVNCNPGSLAPGPGIHSTLNMSVQIIEKDNV